jgi:hypothetical protein
MNFCAQIEEIKNRIQATPDTTTHHIKTPTDSLSLLYSKHTPDDPHRPPDHILQAASITEPISTGPGIEPRRRKSIHPIPRANGRISSSTHLKKEIKIWLLTYIKRHEVLDISKFKQ